MHPIQNEKKKTLFSLEQPQSPRPRTRLLVADACHSGSDRRVTSLYRLPARLSLDEVFPHVVSLVRVANAGIFRSFCFSFLNTV